MPTGGVARMRKKAFTPVFPSARWRSLVSHRRRGTMPPTPPDLSGGHPLLTCGRMTAASSKAAPDRVESGQHRPAIAAANHESGGNSRCVALLHPSREQGIVEFVRSCHGSMAFVTKARTFTAHGLPNIGRASITFPWSHWDESSVTGLFRWSLIILFARGACGPHSMNETIICVRRKQVRN